MMNKVKDCIASYRDEMMEFTKALVSIPTENPPGSHYRECVEMIEHELRRLGLDCNVLEVPSTPANGSSYEHHEEFYPRYCILGGYGGDERTLYFHGHYDVVPAMSREQFLPRIKGGNLYGRGTADMKSGLAAMIYAVKALRDCKIKLRGGVRLVIVPDEESGSRLGAQWLRDKGLLDGNGIGVLTAEPTSGVIWNANRGALSLRVTIKGKPAHVLFQHNGVNAFEQMLVVGNSLLELKREVEINKTRLRIEPYAARSSILMIGGVCQSGISYHTVPAQCSFTLDRRTNPEENLDLEKQKLFGFFDRLKREGINIEVKILQEGASSIVNEDCPLAQALSESVSEITGSPPYFELCPGLLETRFYSSQGIPGLGYGPGLLSVSHGPAEYVKIENMYWCAAIYALTAVRLLGGNGKGTYK